MLILGVVSSARRSVPSAPTIGTATDVGTGRAYNNGAATVTFTAPSYNGGLPITSYTVTSSPGGFTASGASSPLTVTGLASNTAYTFTVKATNAIGQSAASSASNSITATTVPQAPTIGTATDSGTGTTVSVAFTPGATGGKTVTTYTATSSPGGLTGTSASSPITVSGLTAGTAYTFTVTATNANGTSTASAASNSITPQVPAKFESIATINATTGSEFTFSSIPQTYKHLQVRLFEWHNNSANITLRMNGVNTNNYIGRWMGISGATYTLYYGTGSTLTLAYIAGIWQPIGEQGPTGIVIDIPDYTNTSYNKQFEVFTGWWGPSSTEHYLQMGGFTVSSITNAVSSLTFSLTSGVATSMTIALYGIKE